MNYFYDLFLNFNEENVYFYEWDELDNIEHFKRIPVFQVNNKTLNELINNKVSVDTDFIITIKNKSKNKEDIMGNFALFCDKNNGIALEFDDNGIEIARSFLLVVDELNLLDIVYTIPIYPLKYNLIEKLEHKNALRKEEKIKLLISTEINTLLRRENYEKLNYLYIEWFNKKPNNKEEMIKDFSKALDKEINISELKVYDLIKLSYNNV